MSDDTVLQFGRPPQEDAAPVTGNTVRLPTAGEVGASAEASTSAVDPTSISLAATVGVNATTCPTCHSHFSPEGRFCPFDGTPLVPATGWDPSSDPLIGVTVDGRYEVISVIGEGGMGTVYQVRHRALGKRFALKALRKDLAQDGEIAARFIQEARTAAAVSHPGLVEITDFGRLESGQVYFVMELLEGSSLATLLRKGGPLPAERGLGIVRQLVQALRAAHDQNIVHRDLKPDNIHIGREGADGDLVKIVDFGLAKVIGGSKLTRAGVVFGTPHYMSPEQAAGETVDHRTDIYALGIVMYEMFTGRVPFEADSYMGVLTKHMYMTPAPPSELCPEMKSLGALEEVILRCLQKRPEARYQNLTELLDDLEQRLPAVTRSRPRGSRPESVLADELELRGSDRDEGIAVLPAPLPRWPLFALAGALGLGLLAVLLLRSSPKPAPGSALPQARVAGAPSSVVPAQPTTSVVPAADSAPPDAAATNEQPAGKPGLSHARTPAHSAQKTGPNGAVGPRPTQKRPPATRPGSSEIVDPWAR